MKKFAVTVSELRQNIYQLLDQVLDSGVPLEIERKGRKLRIAPEPPRKRLSFSMTVRLSGVQHLVLSVRSPTPRIEILGWPPLSLRDSS